MRNISGTLKAAQEAASGTPYIYLLFTPKGGGTTYNYSSDQASRRILSIDHYEEAYNEYAIIALRNNDRTIPDLRGYWTEIGYGYVTGETVVLPNGNNDDAEFSKTPRLWVKSQRTVSAGGKLFDVLELEGMWAKLGEIILRLGSPPYYTEEYTTDTIYDIITAILAEAGMTLNALGTQDDSIIDDLLPQFEVNNQVFEDAASVIYRLLRMTMCYLRSEPSEAMEVRYPQSADSVNLNYYSDQAFYFYEYNERKNVVVPNHIYVIANEGVDLTYSDVIVGEAEDTTATGQLYDVAYVEEAGELTTQTDADNRALAILTRIQAEQLAGRIVAPHDCRIELYDRVKIWDNR